MYTYICICVSKSYIFIMKSCQLAGKIKNCDKILEIKVFYNWIKSYLKYITNNERFILIM